MSFNLMALVYAALIISLLGIFQDLLNVIRFLAPRRSLIIYDIETILNLDNTHKIVLIGYYDYVTRSYGYCLDPDFSEFKKLVKKRKEVVGFNSLSFDDNICQAHGINVKTTFDVYERLRKAAKQQTRHKKIKGYNLNDVCKRNFGEGKIGTGGNAERLWKSGKIEALVKYCLHDVYLTKLLFEKRRRLKDPNSFWTRLNLEKVV